MVLLRFSIRVNGGKCNLLPLGSLRHRGTRGQDAILPKIQPFGPPCSHVSCRCTLERAVASLDNDDPKGQSMRFLIIFFWTFYIATVASSNSWGQQAPSAAEMAGYLLVPNERVPDDYGAGFSMYVAAWPLLENYPGDRFQTGLFGTWMHPLHSPEPEEKLYNDIEGGLGWWRDTRFATETPKFIMGGVALNFSAWANGPGAGKGRDWDRPNGKYAVVQLSPNVLWPPDGLNLKQGTCGELFGYGYLPLPLTEPKQQTAGQDVPTGNQCWTLFVNAGNFKGPVTFFAPFFWTRPTLERQDLANMFLDVLPSDPNRALQMETQYIPAKQAMDDSGTTYARVAPTRFPLNAGDETMVVHRVMSYRREALWDLVERWFSGGTTASGVIDPDQAVVHKFPGRGGATWRIYDPTLPREARVRVEWDAFATPMAIADDTFGYQWNKTIVGQQQVGDTNCVVLPQYYRLDKTARGNEIWSPIKQDQVPASTRLTETKFPRAKQDAKEPYETPDGEESDWKVPGPASGPHEAYPGDGSVVTYYWYRFADQPALRNADLSSTEREQLQDRVELLHQHWGSDKEYLPPPQQGKLADIDPNLLVVPPKGLEIGYVPIVTRQAPRL